MRSPVARPSSWRALDYVVAWTIAALLVALAIKLGATLVQWISAA